MKRNILLTVIIFFLAFTNNAQNDTMYVMKNGLVVGKYNVNTQIDSIIFYQPQTGNTFTDSRDGNVYQTVTIGNQVWMAENLKYLPSVVGPGTGSLTDPCYYVYGYNDINETVPTATANYITYGVLYNWPAAMNGATSSTANPSGVQGVCPTGWHLPSDLEWTELENYLADNGYQYDGTTGGGGDKIAKSMASAIGWSSSSNTGAVGNTDYPAYINKSGFTALPGGYRYRTGVFNNIGNYSYWWSATENDTYYNWARYMYYDLSNVYRGNYFKRSGFSVRCVRD